MKSRCIFLLDSGAYSVHRRGIKIDIEKYAEFCHKNGRYFRGGIFNLDVIGSDKGSYANWLELKKLGVETIPVHHFGDDEVYLKRYLDQVDYIGIGGMAKLGDIARLSGLERLYKEYLNSSKSRTHGLGLTDWPLMLRYPWFSVDSTRVVFTSSYGRIFIPEFDGSSPTFSKIGMISVSDQYRNHAGGQFSFYGMPRIAKRQLIEFADSLGFVIDEKIEGRELRQLGKFRQKQLPTWSDGLGIDNLCETDSPRDLCIDRNLTRDTNARLAFNLIIVNRFIEYWAERGRDVKMYNVCGGSTELNRFLELMPTNPARCLVSYAAMGDKMMQTIKEGVRGV